MNYRAPFWLPSGHLQTVYPALFLRRTPVAYRRERWDTPDGDFVDVDFVDGQPDRPFVLMFHGLEGSSRSHYCEAFADLARERGWACALPHFRGCSGE
ncbi:MAG TPA: alpha/beta hydrolase, partial [Telluria sp.]|nr:alpha/beta hydrolase [Telluria sp.]